MISIRSANMEDAEAILRVLEGAFRVERSNWKWESWRRLILSEPKSWRVLVKDGEIIGAVHISRDLMRIGNSTIVKGDVGHVSVLPEHQGKGHGTMLMKDTVEWMREEKFDISRLGGLVRFYARFGYHRFPRRYLEFTFSEEKAGASTVKAEGFPIPEHLKYKVRLFNPERDHEYYFKLCEWVESRYMGSPVLKFSKAPAGASLDPLKVVFEEDGKLTAYLFAYELDREYSEFEARIVINGLGYEPGKSYALDALIRYMLNLAVERGFRRVTARIPFDPEILLILSKIPVNFRCVETYGGLGSNMLQIINFKSLFERLIPELEHRIKGSAAQSWRGVLEASIEKERVRLRIEDGRIRLTEEEPSLKLCMPEVHLLKLILSLTSFDQLNEDLGLRGRLSHSDAELLGSLFPSRIAFSGVWG